MIDTIYLLWFGRLKQRSKTRMWLWIEQKNVRGISRVVRNYSNDSKGTASKMVTIWSLAVGDTACFLLDFLEIVCNDEFWQKSEKLNHCKASETESLFVTYQWGETLPDTTNRRGKNHPTRGCLIANHWGVDQTSREENPPLQFAPPASVIIMAVMVPGA